MALAGIALVVAVLAAAVPAQAGVVPNSITSDTTLTAANSPYEVIGNVTVDPDVKLTIEPGVTVDFGENRFEVKGSIDAIGTAANPIRFAYDGDPNSTPVGGAIILMKTTDPNVFRHADFAGSSIYAYSSHLMVSDSDFTGSTGINATGWETGTDFVDVSISDSQFDRAYVRLVVPRGTVSVTGSTFRRGGTGIGIGLGGEGNTTASIKDNLIADNDWFGITFAAIGSDWTASIQDNTIVGNGINVYSRIEQGSSTSFDASGNNILDASQYDWFAEDFSSAGEIHAENNWWGSAD
ncbi:MAG: hypothetical protein ACSLFD_03580, partial [Solirubrobacterales bacterium]